MSKAINYNSNSIVYFKGDINDSIYVLNKGHVSLNYNNIETGQVMHDSIKAGEFFGVRSAIGKYPREETAVVLEDSSMIAFSVSEFELIVLQNTRIMIKILKVFSNQLRRIHKQVRNLLRSGDEITNPETGLFYIGKYYLKANKQKQGIYALKRYLTYYPSSKYSAEALKLLESAESSSLLSKSVIPTNESNIQGNNLPDTVKSYNNALSLYRQEKFEEAFFEFQKILEQSLDGEYEAKAMYEIGRCHFHLKRYDICIKYFTSLIQKYPKHPDLIDALYYIGKSHEENGNIEKAIGFIKKVISMSDDEAHLMHKAKKALDGLKG